MPTARQRSFLRPVRRWWGNNKGAIKNWLTPIFTALIFIVTAVYAGVAILQLREIRNQLQVMRDTLDEQKRAARDISEQQAKLIDANQKLAETAIEQTHLQTRVNAPILSAGIEALKPGLVVGTVATRVGITNNGNTRIVDGMNRIAIEIRESDPPKSYQAQWTIRRNLFIERLIGDLQIEVRTVLSQDDIEQLRAVHPKKFIYVFGVFEYPDAALPSGRAPYAYCFKLGADEKEATACANR